jgi:hypothetical protein
VGGHTVDLGGPSSKSCPRGPRRRPGPAHSLFRRS